jgi:thiosulfate/3-mercaptopyruvate sulfurtransferase
MLPSGETFAKSVGDLGIGDDDLVVAYDTRGVVSAARVWWTFRAFGHDAVAVLNGGLPKWRAEDRPVESGIPAPKPRRFSTRPRPELVRSLAQMRANLTTRREQVLDARSAGRFAGIEPEPRPGVRGGHIPGSRNLPYERLSDATGMMLPPAALRDAFDKAGVDLTGPVVTTCGSGVTASVLALGLYLIGHREVAVYDGSWAEWGSRSDTPIEL